MFAPTIHKYILTLHFGILRRDAIFFFFIRVSYPALYHKHFLQILSRQGWYLSDISCLHPNYGLPNSGLRTMEAKVHMSTSPLLYFNQHCYSHLLRFLLHALLFFHAEEAEEGARSDHTYRSRPPPSTPSLQFPRHLCTSLRLQLHNNKALNLRRGVNPSLKKEK